MKTIKILVEVIVTIISINDKVLVKKDFAIHWIIVLGIFRIIVIFVGANICYNNLLKI